MWNVHYPRAESRKKIRQTAVREGDMLTVAPGDVWTTATFGFNGDARGFQFDDLRNLMFLASFTDGSQGLFVEWCPFHSRGL